MSDSLNEAISALEEYLRSYPSGHFAELAQAKLDRLLAQRGEKKAVLAPAEGNPYTQGTRFADLGYRPGDRYFFSIIDLGTGQSRHSLQTIDSVSESEVVYGRGNLATDLLGNMIRQPPGLVYANHQTFPAEYFVGKKWRSRYQVTTAAKSLIEESIDYAVVGRETVQLQAGPFDAYRIEGAGWASVTAAWVLPRQMEGGRRVYRYWMAPERCRRHLAFESRFWDNSGIPNRNERVELRWFAETR